MPTRQRRIVATTELDFDSEYIISSEQAVDSPVSFGDFANFITTDEPIYNSTYDDAGENLVWGNEGMPSYANASDFPAYELPKWEMGERDTIANLWSRQMDYRLRWIFYREEREGVNRTRYINPFSPEDFRHRIEKTTEPHPANTPTSTFYDWKIGGADFLMRLEKLNVKDSECLRCHFIHKPSGKEVCYQDRVWDGSVYNEINMVWANS